ncbi:anti-sigma regulatory factor [Nostoc sp. DSM 114160]
MRESVTVTITESSQTGEARRVAMALATRLGFQEIERGKVGIVATEIANNLVQHAHGGVVLLRSLKENSKIGIEILALDKGRGMVDVDECLQDGFSTAGTLGNGMGAIRRLSGFLEIYSIPNQGTALLAHLWLNPAPHQPEKFLEIGAICLPKRGEDVSGDTWASEVDSCRNLLLVADGLGHGPCGGFCCFRSRKNVSRTHSSFSGGDRRSCPRRLAKYARRSTRHCRNRL